MKLLFCATALILVTSSLANAAVLTDGDSRPTSIDTISIAGTDYSVLFEYNINQSESAGIGDLPEPDIGAAISQLVSAFSTPLISPLFDPLLIQFVTATGSGNFDSGGAVRFFSGSWASYPSAIGTGITDANANGLGVVSFTSLSTSAVPEPSSLALLAMATCGGVLVYRKNRKAEQAEA